MRRKPHLFGEKMNSLQISLNAVTPFAFYIVYGMILKKLGAVDVDFMKKVNNFSFKCLFPTMIFWNLYSSQDNMVINPTLMIVAISALCVTILAASAFCIKFIADKPKQPVIVQAIYRSNSLLFALPLTTSIFGAESRAVATMTIAVIVPFYNVSSVLLFEFFRGGKRDAKSLLKKVLTNPIIMGAIVGFSAMLIHLHLPAPIEKPIGAISSMVTPLACIILGTQLNMKSVVKDLKYIVPTLAAKLILLPALSLPLSMLFGFSPVERFVFFSIFATPIATSSFPMAASMGGDGDLAAELVAMSTVGSVITLFFWILLLNTTGILFG